MPDLVALLTPHLTAGHLWLYPIIFVVSVLESIAFVGLIVPGTTVTLAAGVLASRHLLDVGDLIIYIALGGFVGDTISFLLGRRGITLFNEQSRFFKKEYLVKGTEFFERYGNKSIFFARFFGPLRSVLPFVAGLVKMDFKKFLFYNVTSAFLSATAYLLFGYFFGQSWRHVRHLHGISEIVFLIVILGVGAWLIGGKEKKLLK
jgi:undecaprenyl-diphosphatase